MSNETRGKDKNWRALREDGTSPDVAHAQLCVLMDLRDELKEANQHLRTIAHILGCARFLNLPTAVNKLVENTTRKPRKKKEPA